MGSRFGLETLNSSSDMWSLGPGRQPCGEVERGDAWGVLGMRLVSEGSAVEGEPQGTVQTDERWPRENPEGD